jgi:uncharacterized protein
MLRQRACKEDRMNDSQIKTWQSMFASRLDTLAHLLKKAEEVFGENGSLLERRIAPDMAPFGTQIAFTCNQPRNFALWMQSQPADNLDHAVTSIRQADAHIRSTKELVLSVSAEDSKLDEAMRLDLGPNIYAELSGREYVNDFLIPNFYFHLVTAYDILRMAGLPLGKPDYMLHLVPFVKPKR